MSTNYRRFRLRVSEIACLACLALHSAAPAQGAPDVAPWGPPLPGPLRLTGTFGEPRSRHLHTGVDFSTGREIGRPVLALDAGSVVRLRARAGGYGRALYLATDRGQLAVYAHLDRFAPEIERFVRRRQMEQGEYEIDLHLPAGRFRFERGDTVAFSGATGAGPPHLHLELRDGDRPLNPLSLGLAAPDRAAPEIRGVRLRALDARGWVDNGAVAEYDLTEAAWASVWGLIGVEFTVTDRCGFTSARLSPLRAGLYLDGRRVYERAFAQLDFSRGKELGRIYGRPLEKLSDWILRMYRWPQAAGPDQSETCLGGGAIDFSQLEPGRHELCFEALDAAGHISEISLEVMVQPPLRPVAWRKGPAGPQGRILGLRLAAPVDSMRLPLQAVWRPAGEDPCGAGRADWLPLGEGWFAVQVPGGELAEVIVQDRLGCAILPPLAVGDSLGGSSPQPDLVIEIAEGGLWFEIMPAQALPDLPRAVLELADGSCQALVARGLAPGGGWGFSLGSEDLRGQPQRLHATLPGGACAWVWDATELSLWSAAGGTLAAPGFALRAGPGCFDAVAVLRQRIISGDAEFAQLDPGLRPLSAVLELGPRWWPLQGSLELSISAGMLLAGGKEPHAQWGLYRLEEDGEWSWVGRERSGAGWGGRVERLGCFALLADECAPQLADPQPPPGAALAQAPARLRVRIREIGSGFEPQDADILLDEEMLPAAWDIDDDILEVRLEEPPRSGHHRWEVRVVDRAGNRVQAAYDFEVAAR